MNNFDLRKYLTENRLNEEDKGAMYQLIKLRDIENPYNLHRDLISSLNRFARATVAKEQGYQGVGLDNELQLTRLDVNNQSSFHKLDREEVKDTLKRALELYRSGLKEQDVITKMTDFGPIDVPNTKKYIKKSPEEMTMKELEKKIEQLENSKFSNENARELMALRSEYSYRTHFKNESLNEGKGRDEARKIIDHLRSKVFKKLNDDELDEFRKEIANAFDIKESVNEDIQSELDKWEGRLYDLENMNKLSNNSDPAKQKKTIEAVKKKIASLKKKIGVNEASKEEMDKFAKFQKDLQKTMSTQGWKYLEDRAKEEKKEREARKSKPIDEIKGFEEFKETGFKLGDKVEFMGSAHPTHIKPIKLTGTIEYFEPADEIGVRVDGYGKFIPFFEIQSNIELID